MKTVTREILQMSLKKVPDTSGRDNAENNRRRRRAAARLIPLQHFIKMNSVALPLGFPRPANAAIPGSLKFKPCFQAALHPECGRPAANDSKPKSQISNCTNTGSGQQGQG